MCTIYTINIRFVLSFQWLTLSIVASDAFEIVGDPQLLWSYKFQLTLWVNFRVIPLEIHFEMKFLLFLTN